MIFYHDHKPPHVHAKYSGNKAVFDFSGEVIGGQLPIRAQRLVKEWVVLHKNELVDNWRRAEKGEKLQPVEPLA